MAGVRIARARLEYGCHAREFELSADDRPLVVAGGNGSGKSTLLEGLVRTVYGFNRRATEDGYTHEQRMPWEGEAYRGRVEVLRPEGQRTAIERDFLGATVAVEPLEPEGEAWTGDGNPAGSNLQAKAFRDRLRDLFGLDNFADYGRTAYVQQGELSNTALGKDLLRAAAGGTIDIDGARDAIRKSHRELTRTPIADGERGGTNARRREELEQRIERLRDELQQAELAERRRLPLLDDRRTIEAELARTRSEIDDLEAAQQPLVDRQELALKLQPLQEKIRRLEGFSQELGLSLAGLQNAVAARTVELGNRAPLPLEFPEHAAALAELWEQLKRQLERRVTLAATLEQIVVPGALWLLPGFALATLGVALFVAGQALGGLPTLAAGCALTAGAWLQRRTQRDRHVVQKAALDDAEAEIARVEQAVEERRALVTDGTELKPETVAVFRDRFERQQRTRDHADRARATLDAVTERAVNLLEDGETHSPEGLLGLLGDRVSKQRTELVRCQRRLEEAAEQPLPLPSGVSADLQSVRDALAKRRRAERELQDRLRETDQRLREEGTPGSSPVALGEALTDLAAELTELDEQIAAYRLAWTLVGQAHGRFRDEDEQRLVAAVSLHLAALSGGSLGPLEVDNGLDAVTLRAFGRSVPLDYRPLSFGQYHIALLAVRLGAADFLARSGIRVPLIIDEPFTNLDDENAALVWRQLERVATERQVIVATQESALLERLGITPDLRL